MKPSDALRLNRDAILRTTARYGLSNPRVFGSTARGEDTEQSDLDLLVDKNEHTSLFNLGDLENDLCNLLGVRVDIVTSGNLHRRIRKRVLEEAVPV